jgi:hypothetical protein
MVQLHVSDDLTETSRLLTFSRHSFFNKHLDPLVQNHEQEEEWDDLVAGGRSHRVTLTTHKLAW